MTTVADIIRDAYRESNLIAIGTEPSGAQAEEALVLLNRLVASCYGSEVGEELAPVVIGRNNISRPTSYPWYQQVPDDSEWFVPDNARLILNLTSAQSVYLHPNPDDGARFAFIDKSGNLATNHLTVYGNGRTINSQNSVTYSTNSLAAQFIYRADTGNWAVISPLETTDVFPFPSEFEDFFVIGLATRLNPRYQQALNPASLAAMKRTETQFQARYRQHKQSSSELGLIRTFSNNRYSDDTRRGNADFSSGFPNGDNLW